jgi:TolB-like protein
VKFLSEFKRRKVLNTASLYVVGVWVLLQVLEVLQQFFPPGAMRLALIGAAALYPAVFLAGWFFDISKEGITLTSPASPDEALPDPSFIDYVQLAGHVLVIGFVGYILSVPPPVDIPAPAADATAKQRTIAVLAFDDLQPAAEGEDIGETISGELRDSLTRVAGLRVLGPETSKALSLAGEGRLAMAKELAVTALLLGEILLDGGQLRIDARLVGVPGGNELWANRAEGPSGDGVALQQGLLRQVVGAIAPRLDPDPVQGPRAEAGACSTVYDVYLRGKRLSKARRFTQAELWNRGMELLRQAVSTDPDCALAWEAIAVALQRYQETGGFVRAAVAARRALELNDTLPEAWVVMAEIAEDEGRWSTAEEYMLKALRADPTNSEANINYSLNLLTRGRVREGLQLALEAYRRDPASDAASHMVVLGAHYAGDTELMIRHSQIAIELTGLRNAYMLESIAEAHRMRGETDRALEVFAEDPQYPDWFPDCVRLQDDPGLSPSVRDRVQETLRQILAGETPASWANSWRVIRCAVWLEDPDIFYGLLLAEDIDTMFGKGFPKEIVFTNLWHQDAAAMRRDPRFRELVLETGLLDYWKQWGWADLCRPDGDSFACD